MFWVQRAALLVAFCSFVSLFGVKIGGALHLVTAILVSIPGLWLAFTEFRCQAGMAGKYSPGANDNASGVAVLLVAGELLIKQGESAKVGWIYTSAEETGLHGAIKAAQWIKENAPDASVISLDMVGCGSDLRVAVKDGTIFPVYPDKNLINFVKKTLPGVRDLWYTLRSGDFAMFVRQGISATGLQLLGGKDAHLKYHGIDDLPDGVEPEALERMVWSVLSLVQAKKRDFGK
ncbi:MAG TPA: M28 family peptidase [Anaerolineaceae bacterium]